MDSYEKNIQDYLLFIKNNREYFINTENGIQVVTEAEEIHKSIELLKEKYSSERKPPYWKNIGIAYEDSWLWLLCDVVRFQNNQLNTHHRIIRKSGNIAGVAILGVYKGKIILLRHFRHPARKEFIEIPRGGVIGGKSLEETVIQEIEEEFDGKLKKLVKLQLIHPSTSVDTASILCFYGEYESIGKPSLSEGILEVIQMAPDELEQAIKNGTVTDAVTICVFYQSILHGYIK